MQRVINFSGGKTSAYMTIHEYREGDLVIFCDTGREHPKTYKFINDFEANEKIPIIRLKYYNSENPFDLLLSKRKYKILPNRMRRFCTDELKVKTARRYLRSIGFKNYETEVLFYQLTDELDVIWEHVKPNVFKCNEDYVFQHICSMVHKLTNKKDNTDLLFSYIHHKI